MKRITNLEDLLHEYKFVPKSKPVFRKRIIWVDNLPETGTKAGHIYTIAEVERLDTDFWQYILKDGTILFDSDIEFVFKGEGK